jgi:hypothetical protein
MAHGYNCIKELYLDRYAAAVADAGHVVLAYGQRRQSVRSFIGLTECSSVTSGIS